MLLFSNRLRRADCLLMKNHRIQSFNIINVFDQNGLSKLQNITSSAFKKLLQQYSIFLVNKINIYLTNKT